MVRALPTCPPSRPQGSKPSGTRREKFDRQTPKAHAQEHQGTGSLLHCCRTLQDVRGLLVSKFLQWLIGGGGKALPLWVNIKIKGGRVYKMVQQLKVLSAQAWWPELDPWHPRWKERTCSLTSDWVLGHEPFGVQTHTHKNNNVNFTKEKQPRDMERKD